MPHACRLVPGGWPHAVLERAGSGASDGDGRPMTLRASQIARLSARTQANASTDEPTDTESAEDLFKLAKGLHMRQGASEVRAAEVLYRRCLRLSPTHVGALSNYGLLHQHTLQNLDAAESLYTRAEELNATSTIIQHNLAMLANLRGRHDEAEARFKSVLSLDQDYAPSLFYYATFLAQTREAYDTAEAYTFSEVLA